MRWVFNQSVIIDDNSDPIGSVIHSTWGALLNDMDLCSWEVVEYDLLGFFSFLANAL